MYTYDFLLVSFRVVFLKLCLSGIELKSVTKKSNPETKCLPPKKPATQNQQPM